jgi:hypothetical protein
VTEVLTPKSQEKKGDEVLAPILLAQNINLDELLDSQRVQFDTDLPSSIPQTTSLTQIIAHQKGDVTPRACVSRNLVQHTNQPNSRMSYRNQK